MHKLLFFPSPSCCSLPAINARCLPILFQYSILQFYTSGYPGLLSGLSVHIYYQLLFFHLDYYNWQNLSNCGSYHPPLNNIKSSFIKDTQFAHCLFEQRKKACCLRKNVTCIRNLSFIKLNCRFKEKSHD